MGIYKRRNTWWFKKVYNGRKIEESLGTPNKTLAERIYAKKLTEIIDGTYFNRTKKITMRELIDKYMNEVSCQLADSTHERNRQLAKNLVPYMGHLLIQDVSPSFLSTYKTKRLKQ